MPFGFRYALGMHTLTVHSSLTAVGFLHYHRSVGAGGISVNALGVLSRSSVRSLERRDEVMELLKE
jgi:hypothetical protein